MPQVHNKVSVPPLHNASPHFHNLSQQFVFLSTNSSCSLVFLCEW